MKPQWQGLIAVTEDRTANAALTYDALGGYKVMSIAAMQNLQLDQLTTKHDIARHDLAFTGSTNRLNHCRPVPEPDIKCGMSC